MGDATEQIIPIEIDMELVRRSRERGIRGLGQMAKSFRDRTVDFAIYRREPNPENGKSAHEYLDSLGPLTKPVRGSRAGLKAS